ncbi:MAG: GntR family transcriptional regulator [Candidatus Eremiobacteraeota bacterium]|nr:GntR family transcriptional regulator [Candidatus Eremiobacteraeota bacterium]
MPVLFAIDPRSGVPIYLQLTDQLKRAVAVGALAPGERLPTVKALAMQLTLNPNTIAKVYRDLEREGVIETAPGRGSFVTGNGTVDKARVVASEVAQRAVREAVREARALGVPRDELRKLVETEIARWFPEDET